MVGQLGYVSVSVAKKRWPKSKLLLNKNVRSCGCLKGQRLKDRGEDLTGK